MKDEELIETLKNLQLTEANETDNTELGIMTNTSSSNPSGESTLARKWPNWSGDPVDFAVFQISLEGIAEGFKGDRSFCYEVFSNSLPLEAQKRVAPWMKERKLSNEWDINQFLTHLEDLFTDKDASNRAQTKLYAIRQGSRQLFSHFRSVFEQICSEAEKLAPTGPAKVNAMKTALAPYLQQGIAYRKQVSKVDYEMFAEEVQDLASTLEALPSFRNSRGSIKEYFVYDKIVVNTDSGVLEQAPSPAPKCIFDQDGDTKMSGVNNL